MTDEPRIPEVEQPSRSQPSRSRKRPLLIIVALGLIGLGMLAFVGSAIVAAFVPVRVVTSPPAPPAPPSPPEVEPIEGFNPLEEGEINEWQRDLEENMADWQADFDEGMAEFEAEMVEFEQEMAAFEAEMQAFEARGGENSPMAVAARAMNSIGRVIVGFSLLGFGLYFLLRPKNDDTPSEGPPPVEPSPAV